MEKQLALAANSLWDKRKKLKKPPESLRPPFSYPVILFGSASSALREEARLALRSLVGTVFTHELAECDISLGADIPAADFYVAFDALSAQLVSAIRGDCFRCYWHSSESREGYSRAAKKSREWDLVFTQSKSPKPDLLELAPVRSVDTSVFCLGLADPSSSCDILVLGDIPNADFSGLTVRSVSEFSSPEARSRAYRSAQVCLDTGSPGSVKFSDPGSSLIEAALCGCAIVTSRERHVPDVLARACAVASDSREAAERAVIMALRPLERPPKQELSAVARSAKKEFSREKLAESLREMFSRFND